MGISPEIRRRFPLPWARGRQPSPPVREPPLPPAIRDTQITVVSDEIPFFESLARADLPSSRSHHEAVSLQGRRWTATVGEISQDTGISGTVIYNDAALHPGVYELTPPHGETTLPTLPTNDHIQRPK